MMEKKHITRIKIILYINYMWFFLYYRTILIKFKIIQLSLETGNETFILFTRIPFVVRFKTKSKICI
jgi:hypothetical protein